MFGKGKCFWLDVETGSLIFAIINLLITAVGTGMSMGFLKYIDISVDVAVNIIGEPWVQEVRENKDVDRRALYLEMVVNFVLTINVAVNVIALAFAILLILGILKRNSNVVKAYFIAGVMFLCLWAIMTIVVMVSFAYYGIGGLLNFISFIIYGFILYMIRMTYIKFQEEFTYKLCSNPRAVI